MKRWHLIATVVAIALSVACTVGIMNAIHTSRPSTKEVELQAQLAVWQERAKSAFAQSASMRINAQKQEAIILQLKKDLSNNKTRTNEKTDHIDQLYGDSLGRYVSEHINLLHSSWY